MKLLYTSLFFIIVISCLAQEYQITRFEMPQLSGSEISNVRFLEDAEGSIWLFTTNELKEDIIMRFTGEVWENIPGPCSSCYKDVAMNKAGIIYFAGGLDGLFEYSNDNWSRILTIESRNVFVDAFDQLAIITDTGVGKVIDGEFVATDNSNFVSIQFRETVITNENRMFFLGGVREYSYECGWTNLTRPQLTLGAPFGYIGIQKDTNDLLHYAIRYNPPAPTYTQIGAIDDGKYIGVDLLHNYADFFAFVIDQNNAFWTIGFDFLRKDNGKNLQIWSVAELFPDTPNDGYNLFSIFTDSYSNCWVFNRESNHVSVLHIDDLNQGQGLVTNSVDPVELDCSTFTYDVDGDGYTSDVDCNDNLYWINPGETEIPYNNRDDDCNPETPDNDLDQDGFLRIDDCDDTNSLIYPGAPEECDSIDYNCDGMVDFTIQYQDLDNDGFGDISRDTLFCGDLVGFSLQSGDCDDTNPTINPEIEEVPYNGIDEDCNEATLDDDLDQDGFGIDMDCDDTNPTINPEIEEVIYNGLDDDCNPMTLDDDLDQDGFGLDMDCDDLNSAINPEVEEIAYNGIDDDCNEATPDDDLDQDGFGIDEDCDDTNVNINPDAEEIINNGIDEDCDGMDLTSSAYVLNGVEFNVYPNPTRSIVYIDYDSSLEFNIRVYSIQGVLLEIDFNNKQCDLSAHPEGVYLINITDMKTGESLVKNVYKFE